MKCKLKYWPGYYGKWEVFKSDDDRFENFEVEIDDKILEEYRIITDALRELNDTIFKKCAEGYRESNKKEM